MQQQFKSLSSGLLCQWSVPLGKITMCSKLVFLWRQFGTNLCFKEGRLSPPPPTDKAVYDKEGNDTDDGLETWVSRV